MTLMLPAISRTWTGGLRASARISVGAVVLHITHPKQALCSDGEQHGEKPLQVSASGEFQKRSLFACLAVDGRHVKAWWKKG